MVEIEASLEAAPPCTAGLNGSMLAVLAAKTLSGRAPEELSDKENRALTGLVSERFLGKLWHSLRVTALGAVNSRVHYSDNRPQFGRPSNSGRT